MRASIMLLLLPVVAAACAEQTPEPSGGEPPAEAPLAPRLLPPSEREAIDDMIVDVVLLRDDLESLERLEASDSICDHPRARGAVIQRILEIKAGIAAAKRDRALSTPQGRGRFAEEVEGRFALLGGAIRDRFPSPDYRKVLADREALDRMLDGLKEGDPALVLSVWQGLEKEPPKSYWARRHWEEIRAEMRTVVEAASRELEGGK
jgi:hypothetical protein